MHVTCPDLRPPYHNYVLSGTPHPLLSGVLCLGVRLPADSALPYVIGADMLFGTGLVSAGTCVETFKGFPFLLLKLHFLLIGSCPLCIGAPSVFGL